MTTSLPLPLLLPLSTRSANKFAALVALLLTVLTFQPALASYIDLFLPYNKYIFSCTCTFNLLCACAYFYSVFFSFIFFFGFFLLLTFGRWFLALAMQETQNRGPLMRAGQRLVEILQAQTKAATATTT